MVHFSLIDSLLIVIYFVAVLYVGFRAIRQRRNESDDFLLAGPLAAGSTVTSYNHDGLAVATVEARCIEQTGATIPSISEAANHLPRLRHIAPPPPASGYSLKYFEVRRYGITATSNTGNSQIQVGAWKAFNKY